MPVVKEKHSEERHSTECPMTPFSRKAGACDACGRALPPRHTRWCSTRCRVDVLINHRWSNARSAAKRRDKYRCRHCRAKREVGGPALEVNHKVPRVGAGYGWGCHNHLDNLETLCRACHRVVTNAQAAERRAAAA